MNRRSFLLGSLGAGISLFINPTSNLNQGNGVIDLNGVPNSHQSFGIDKSLEHLGFWIKEPHGIVVIDDCVFSDKYLGLKEGYLILFPSVPYVPHYYNNGIYGFDVLPIIGTEFVTYIPKKHMPWPKEKMISPFCKVYDGKTGKRVDPNIVYKKVV